MKQDACWAADAAAPAIMWARLRGGQSFLMPLADALEWPAVRPELDAGSVRFEAVCAGFSGGPTDKDALLREAVRGSQYTMTTDAMIALSGATAGAPGIITIAGTGSISYGRNASREVARVGGWGYVFGDEGGGFDITRQALRAVLRHEEGWGPGTALREALLSATGAGDATI